MGLHLQVVISQLDVSDLGQTAELLEEAAAMGPVAGIFHLAMVLTDKWLINQVSPPFPEISPTLVSLSNTWSSCKENTRKQPLLRCTVLQPAN